MTKQTVIAPVVMASRFGFTDQAAELKALKAVSNKVKVNGVEVGRTGMNGYADQPETDVFSGVIGFQTVAIDDWLALPAYEANRPWEKRYQDKAHLRGKLSNPLQTLGFALVNEAGELVCRLDGNGRAGAWMAGALEKPQFLHVMTFVLPEGFTQGSYFVSNLFDVLNGDAQKVSTEHKAEIAKRRLIVSGEWVEFDTSFVSDVKATAFLDIKTLLNRPAMAKPSAADFIISNKELIFLVDQLGIDVQEVKKKDENCYLSTIFTMMLKTMLNPAEGEDSQRQAKAFLFWKQWGKADASPIIQELFEFVATADQSGAKAKKDLRAHIEGQFGKWRDDNTVPKGFELPSFDKWDEGKKAAAADALKKMEEQEAQREQDRNELFGQAQTIPAALVEQVRAADEAAGLLPQDKPELTEVEKAKADLEECRAIADALQAKLKEVGGEKKAAVLEELKAASQAVQDAKDLLAMAEEEAAK